MSSAAALSHSTFRSQGIPTVNTTPEVRESLLRGKVSAAPEAQVPRKRSYHSQLNLNIILRCVNGIKPLREGLTPLSSPSWSFATGGLPSEGDSLRGPLRVALHALGAIRGRVSDDQTCQNRATCEQVHHTT